MAADRAASAANRSAQCRAYATARQPLGGEHRVSVIGVPGSLTPTRLEELGVARISYGPWTQRVALTALQSSAKELLAGGHLPEGTQPLN